MAKNNLTLEVEKLRKEFYESLRKHDESLHKHDEIMRRIDERMERQSKLSEQTDKRLGRFANSFGDFVESVAAPSIPEVMKKHGITVRSMYRNALSRRNGSSMEVDVLCLGKRENGEEVMLLAEIKSKVAPEDVRELIKEIQAFHRFFPEYGKRPKIGILAGITVPDDVALHAERLGLYVLGPSGETLRLLNKKGFKPIVWR